MDKLSNIMRIFRVKYISKNGKLFNRFGSILSFDVVL